MAYELNFASNPNEDNIIKGVAINKTTRKTSPFTQDCSKMRQFWLKWANNVISGGLGFKPGTKEVMRLVDKGERYGKIVTLANVLTEPNDETVVFTFYPGMWLYMMRQFSDILCSCAISFYAYKYNHLIQTVCIVSLQLCVCSNSK